MSDYPLVPPSEVLELEDLFPTAALSLAGFEYRTVRVGRRHRFLFDPSASDTLNRYFRGELQVDARSYADALRALRAAVHIGGGR